MVKFHLSSRDRPCWLELENFVGTTKDQSQIWRSVTELKRRKEAPCMNFYHSSALNVQVYLLVMGTALDVMTCRLCFGVRARDLVL